MRQNKVTEYCHGMVMNHERLRGGFERVLLKDALNWMPVNDDLLFIKVENKRGWLWRRHFEKSEQDIIRRWNYIGHGSFNVAYRSGNEVYKIPIDSTEKMDTPDRAVRVWNEIVEADTHPEFKARVDGDGWVMPYIKGEHPSSSEICEALLDIYKRTRRIVVDAFVAEDSASKKFINFVKTRDEQGRHKVICIDVGNAVRLAEYPDKSISSMDMWKVMEKIYCQDFNSLVRSKKNSDIAAIIHLIKALLFVETYTIELKNIDALKHDKKLVGLLAKAFDDKDIFVKIDDSYLLSSNDMIQETEVAFNEKIQNEFKHRKYDRYCILKKMGFEEYVARIISRNPDFNHIYAEESYCELQAIITEFSQHPSLLETVLAFYPYGFGKTEIKSVLFQGIELSKELYAFLSAYTEFSKSALPIFIKNMFSDNDPLSDMDFKVFANIFFSLRNSMGASLLNAFLVNAITIKKFMSLFSRGVPEISDHQFKMLLNNHSSGLTLQDFNYFDSHRPRIMVSQLHQSAIEAIHGYGISWEIACRTAVLWSDNIENYEKLIDDNFIALIINKNFDIDKLSEMQASVNTKKEYSLPISARLQFLEAFDWINQQLRLTKNTESPTFFSTNNRSSALGFKNFKKDILKVCNTISLFVIVYEYYEQESTTLMRNFFKTCAEKIVNDMTQEVVIGYVMEKIKTMSLSRRESASLCALISETTTIASLRSVISRQYRVALSEPLRILSMIQSMMYTAKESTMRVAVRI